MTAQLPSDIATPGNVYKRWSCVLKVVSWFILRKPSSPWKPLTCTVEDREMDRKFSLYPVTADSLDHIDVCIIYTSSELDYFNSCQRALNWNRKSHFPSRWTENNVYSSDTLKLLTHRPFPLDDSNLSSTFACALFIPDATAKGRTASIFRAEMEFR